MSNKAFFKQIGGAHYKKYKIQPSLFINKNKVTQLNIFADTKIKERNRIC